MTCVRSASKICLVDFRMYFKGEKKFVFSYMKAVYMIVSPFLIAKKLFGKASFRWKAIIFIASIEGLFNIMFAIIIVNVMSNNLEEQFRKRAEITAQLFSTSIENAVLATDFATLESFADKVMSNNDLLYATVLDLSGVLVERGDADALAREFKADENLSTVEDGVFDTFSEIRLDDEVYGRVEIGLKTTLLGNTISAIQLKVIMIGAGEIIFSAFVSFVLGTFLVKRLQNLESGSELIAAGNYGSQILVDGEDELANTAKAFNIMSLKVADAIQELEQRNRELKMQRNYLQAILDTALNGIIVINERGIIENFNRHADALFDYSAEEVIGKNVKTLMPEPDRSGHDGYIKNFLTTGEKKIIGTNREVEGLRKDGTCFALSLAISEMETVDGIRRFVGILDDITARKEAEARLIEARAEAEIQKKCALEARDAAEAANDAKSNFLAVISHELRTPTQGIKGPFEEFAKQFEDFVGMQDLPRLLDTLDDDLRNEVEAAISSLHNEVVEVAEGGLRSADHLLTLIGEILNFDKMDAGKLNIEQTHLPLKEAVDQAINIVESKITAKGLALEIKIDPNLAVFADPIRFRQIILNLVSNAEKFTDHGCITIAATHHNEMVQIDIHDSGCGIPENKHSLIFTAFEQVGDSMTRRAGGTGLGLPLTKGLVMRQGGEIWVESIEGKGSTFSFTLPASTDDEHDNNV